MVPEIDFSPPSSRTSPRTTSRISSKRWVRERPQAHVNRCEKMSRAHGRSPATRMRRGRRDQQLLVSLGSLLLWAGGLSAASTSSITELIDAGGKLASASEITSLLSGFGGKAMNVVGVLGSKGSGKSTLMNQAFGTSFPERGPLCEGDTTGVCAATCDGVLLLDCDGVEEGADPTSTTKGITSGQATAFSAALSDVLVVNLWRSDLGRSVASNVRTIKAMFCEKLQEMRPNSTPAESSPRASTAVIVVVRDCDPGADAGALETAVMEEMAAVWKELDHPEGGVFEDFFDVQVINFNLRSSGAFISCWGYL